MALAAGVGQRIVQLGHYLVDVVRPVHGAISFNDAQFDIEIWDYRELEQPAKEQQPEIYKNNQLFLIAPHQYDQWQQHPRSPECLVFPTSKKLLKEAINRVLVRSNNSNSTTGSEEPSSDPIKLNDRIFVRHKDKMVKLEISNILYIEAESNYSRIFTRGKEYLLANTLKRMESKLPANVFFRIHRSYIVNLRQIDEVSETHLVIDRKALPISKSLRPGLLKRIQTI